MKLLIHSKASTIWFDKQFHPTPFCDLLLMLGLKLTHVSKRNPWMEIAVTAYTGPTAHTVYPKKYAHGFCFAVLCCGYTLTDFPISIRLTSLALWQSNDCPSASKATLMNKDKYFMWIHYERLHNYNKAKHIKTVCIFLGIYCICCSRYQTTLLMDTRWHFCRNKILEINKY